MRLLIQNGQVIDPASQTNEIRWHHFKNRKKYYR